MFSVKPTTGVHVYGLEKFVPQGSVEAISRLRVGIAAFMLGVSPYEYIMVNSASGFWRFLVFGAAPAVQYGRTFHHSRHDDIEVTGKGALVVFQEVLFGGLEDDHHKSG